MPLANDFADKHMLTAPTKTHTRGTKKKERKKKLQDLSYHILCKENMFKIYNS